MVRVLLVEDHPMNRKLFRDILEMQFDVTEAVTGEEALDLVAESHPDLILLDMQLPGIDGLTVASRLKADAATAGIPIIGLSAHAMKRDIDLAMALGCADYITKPITDDPLTLLDRISRSLTPRTS